MNKVGKSGSIGKCPRLPKHLIFSEAVLAQLSAVLSCYCESRLQVRKVVEEEYCLIPMGGGLPKRDQRVVGVGGTAGLVHPSTGYMVARTLGAVPQLADRIVDELAVPLPDGPAAGVPLSIPEANSVLCCNELAVPLPDGPAAGVPLSVPASW